MFRAPGKGSELLGRDLGCELGVAEDETRRGGEARLAVLAGRLELARPPWGFSSLLRLESL